MNILINNNCNYTDIKNLRHFYFDELSESQELFLEIQIQKGIYFKIFLDEIECGYFILIEDNVLLEFYMLKKYRESIDNIFKSIIAKFQIKFVYCKSYDSILWNVSNSIKNSHKIIGYNYRGYRSKQINHKKHNIKTRFASAKDFLVIKSFNEDIFDLDKEIEDYIQKEQIIIFEKNFQIFGFGIFAPSIINRPEYDIGMLVVKEFRRQGLATYILQYMAEYCIENNWIPTAGCDAENIGSQKTIEKIGFTKKYPLYEITFE